MRIALEIPYYASGGARGTYIYGINLHNALRRLDPGLDLVAFSYFRRSHAEHVARLSARLAPGSRLLAPAWSQRLVDWAEQSWGYPFVERGFLEPERIDVFHQTGGHPARSRRAARVFTLHGTGIDSGGITPEFRRHVPRLLECERIIVLGEVCRDFLLKYYPFPPERLVLIPVGIDPSTFRPIEDRAALEAVARRLALPERFILCVGPFQFRDNIEHVLAALESRSAHPALKDVHLVLAGGLEEHGPELKRRVESSPAAGRVRFIGHVPHQDLAAVYNLAEALVHPSYYEELGAALREAAACGLPVLASAAGGNEEALRDAGVYFSPHLIGDLEKQLVRVLSSPELKAGMREKGLALCRGLTWEAAARRTLQCYRDALAERG